MSWVCLHARLGRRESAKQRVIRFAEVDGEAAGRGAAKTRRASDGFAAARALPQLARRATFGGHALARIKLDNRAEGNALQSGQAKEDGLKLLGNRDAYTTATLSCGTLRRAESLLTS